MIAIQLTTRFWIRIHIPGVGRRNTVIVFRRQGRISSISNLLRPINRCSIAITTWIIAIIVIPWISRIKQLRMLSDKSISSIGYHRRIFSYGNRRQYSP